MLIPFGVFSAAGSGGGGGGGSYELIETAYGTGSSGTISFTSIPQDYKHLQLRYTSRATNADWVNSSRIRLNGDSAGNYSRHMLYGLNTSVNANAGASVTSSLWHYSAGDTTITGAYAAGIVDILDYASTTKNTTIRGFNGNQGLTANPSATWQVTLVSGGWYNTAAVTSLTFEAASGSFTTASRYSLYGIKG
jgi:hypothetical protein